MEHYVYKPIRFYITVFALTWGFWIAALLLKDTTLLYVFMILGLLSPAATAVMTVLTSKNKMLKTDLKRKLIGFYRIYTYACSLLLLRGRSIYRYIGLIRRLIRAVLIHGGFFLFDRRQLRSADDTSRFYYRGARLARRTSLAR